MFKKENKKENKEEKKEEIKKRQIIIETDGNSVTVLKAEVAGKLEFQAILSSIMNTLNQ